MEIEDVLKNEDKAIPVYQEKNRFSNVYASLDDGGVLWWHSMESDERLEPVPLAAINEKEWGAYHEVKEIRPEKAGELWQRDNESSHRCLVYGDNGILYVMWWGGTITPNSDRVHRDMVHGKNGWKRISPRVEDDSVETVEIEAIWNAKRCRFEIVSPLVKMDCLGDGPHKITFKMPKI